MLDQRQAEIIRADVGDRLIVDAGPGTGKTFLACARLGYLISEHELNPARTWMISFTRTAVAEIKARLHGFIGDPSFSIKVATIDSHAWAIHSGYDETASLTGSYEENIERVLELVREDPEVTDYLANVEHLIVDEAQDLVGIRADLVQAIIEHLQPDCGVTIFADEAQAIYGFSEERDRTAMSEGAAFLNRLRADESLGFSEASLSTIYRTNSNRLRRISTDVRSMLLGAGRDSDGIFQRIRDSIAGLAHNSELRVTDLGIDSLSAGSLVLFRRRPEALGASQFCAAPHSLRLSGYAPSLPAWLGACFADWTGAYIGEQEFADLWATRVEIVCPPEYDCEEAWRKLARLAGSGDGSVELQRLRWQLGRRNLPVELASSEFGLPGPIIGTIHASKGREADEVFLLLPQSEEFKTPEDEEEETRVLFVGSTRARRRLSVGNASRYPGSSLDSGRSYRILKKQGNRVGAMVEIGLNNDVTALGLVARSHHDPESCAVAQDWLTQHSGVLSKFELQRSREHDWNYKLMEPETGQHIALMPDAFKNELWEIANIGGYRYDVKLGTPSKILNVRGLGSRTVVLAPEDSSAERLHAPWSRSGFMLAPRIAAFTKATMWIRR